MKYEVTPEIVRLVASSVSKSLMDENTLERALKAAQRLADQYSELAKPSESDVKSIQAKFATDCLAHNARVGPLGDVVTATRMELVVKTFLHAIGHTKVKQPRFRSLPPRVANEFWFEKM